MSLVIYRMQDIAQSRTLLPLLPLSPLISPNHEGMNATKNCFLHILFKILNIVIKRRVLFPIRLHSPLLFWTAIIFV
jgi:hypothetical protein